MAVKTKKKNVKAAKKSFPSPFNIYWEKTNYLLFGIGLLLVILGFYFMSLGEWNSFSALMISPILLFIGFVIVLPASILYHKKASSQIESVKSEN